MAAAPSADRWRPPPTGFSVLLTDVIVLAVIVITEILAAPETEAVDSIEIVEDVRPSA